MSKKFDPVRRDLLRGAVAAGTVGASSLKTAAAVGAGEKRVKAIDVHTHMYTRGWQEVVRKANDAHIKLTPGRNGVDSMFYLWANVGVLPDEMFDRVGTHNERGPMKLSDLLSGAVKHLQHHLKFVVDKREKLGKRMW